MERATLLAPLALVRYRTFETGPDGCVIPTIEPQLFSVDGFTIDMEHYILVEFGRDAVKAIRDLRADLIVILKKSGIRVLNDEWAETRVEGMRASEEILPGPSGAEKDLTLQEIFFYRSLG